MAKRSTSAPSPGNTLGTILAGFPLQEIAETFNKKFKGVPARVKVCVIMVNNRSKRTNKSTRQLESVAAS